MTHSLDPIDRDYVLGTHDAEIERLGLQHREWRSRVLDAWARAGFGPGQTILDVGSGPGFAAIDLAGIVGPGGSVVAIERSARFREHAAELCAARGLNNVVVTDADLERDRLPEVLADGAWCRWVLAFMADPKRLLSRLAQRLKPGAPLVLVEYLHYESWNLLPVSPLFRKFVAAVVDAWRADGGEPNVGARLHAWLPAAGFTVISTRPMIDLVTPADGLWRWMAAFVRVGSARMVELGRLSPDEARALVVELDDCAARAGSWCITPSVVEVIALRG